MTKHTPGMNLPTKTIQDIREMDPCYDPMQYLPEDWTGTALDILNVEDAPAQDRLWVVCHQGWIDDRTLRLFAVWCARESMKLADNPDPRSIAACDVAERYANGEATKDELAAARDAARAASVWAAAWDAAWDAAWAAAWYAASAAARAAARAAAWAAARDAARDAARAAAWYAAWAAQVEKLKEMLEADDDLPPA